MGTAGTRATADGTSAGQGSLVAASGSGAAMSGAGGAIGGAIGGASGGAAGSTAGSAGRGQTDGVGADGGRSGASGTAGDGGRSGSNVAGAVGNSGGSGTGGASTPAGLTPVYRIPLRVHVGMSKLTDAELQPTFAELNSIWLSQGGICFEIEVTTSETNRSDGFDFRYTSGTIPAATSANGLYQNARSIWSVDHPRLNDASKSVMNPTARTTAHELGHGLGLAHENPPPSDDCSSPCYCVQLGDDCDEYLMRSGTKGFHVSKPEVEIARARAARLALPAGPSQCGAPVFMR